MKQLMAENIIDELVKLTPEFKDYDDFTIFDINNKDEKRHLVDVFGQFLQERIEHYPETDSVIQRVYKFLNEQFNDPETDKAVLDYLIVDIFENLSPYDKGMEVSRKLLTGQALVAFNETAKYY